MTDPGGSLVAPDTASAATMRCAVHRDVAATGVCTRCGDYGCADCHKLILARPVCANCRALPGVDYLEETRLRFWGKRDFYVWYWGAFGLFCELTVLARGMAPLDRPSTVSLLLSIPVAAAYLCLWPRARKALVAVNVLSALISLSEVIRPGVHTMTAAELQAMQTAGGRTVVAFATLGASLFGVLLAIAAYQSPRNKLAFELEVDERALQRVYDTHVSNPLATRAAWYSLLGVIPFASLITLGMGWVALRRVDADAWPPRGGRTPALIAIVVSAVWVLIWAGVFLAAFARVRNGAH